MKNKTMRLEIRLTEEEAKIIRQKATRYGGNASALIRDAVIKFDDRKAKSKLEMMAALLSFYKTYQQQLSWLGGNFNQSMHRANELAIDGKLSSDYFQNIIVPKTVEAINSLREIKSALDDIHEQLEQ